ncbi:TOMM precursor leader peptide-binding protein [Streptomyces pseudovenezuelae]|uniref:TOMM precursor leader peptide-binding protein n=1 Tax=Streptomyces pseudovenezuelae TaxID=67350 RepID=UPI002E80ACD3|nr:TOMM precursor leader peptide-binding protein [Streptomyces pseudovenezuelae]WUA85908.1 TOMM precursor leader peptide-binding protein [Streptomyces pseudovenezuelae]
MAATLPVIATGGFGEHVGRVLSALRPGTEVLPVSQLRRAAGEFDGPVVLAAWRPEPALFQELDSLAHETGRNWLPVVLESATVRIGPLIRPFHAPCFRCYRRRRAQHDLQSSISLLLTERYDRDPSCGPGGFLPHHARAAAAVAAGYADGAAGTGTGLVSTVRLREWGVDAHRVVPWHDCEHCAVGPADERGLQRLKSALPAPSTRRDAREVRR